MREDRELEGNLQVTTLAVATSAQFYDVGTLQEQEDELQPVRMGAESSLRSRSELEQRLEFSRAE